MSNDKWWRRSVVYQIYPQSFNDSNNDGFGDIKGIIDKLDYLSLLGIDIIWLNPLYKSPMVDNGYDISDYSSLNEIYGNMDDFKLLLKKAHEKNIKVIMDLVVNHTSDQHHWFIESKKSRNNQYADYYIWKDANEDGSLPNNWIASFGGPAWTYCESRNQYYLHLFAKEQPDLNWENAIVRREIYDMMTDWFELGIDGFRMDVISLISKNPEFPDAPKNFKATKNYYFGASNGPRVHEFLQEMNKDVLSQYDIVTVGETPNTDSKQALMYTDPNRNELDMIFHFDHMHLDYGPFGKFSDVRFKLSDLRKTMSKWQYDLDKGWNSLYWSNHDQPRAVTRFGDEQKYRVESAKMLGTLLHMMKGTPYIFQGEEIGMKNVPFETVEQYKDIETINTMNDMLSKGASQEYVKKSAYLKSRDNARTPMPWNGNSEKGYGFSEAMPWIDYSPDNKMINVKDALQNSNSVFYHYQKLIALRKEYDVVVYGKYKLLDKYDSDVYFYSRNTDDETLYVICSFSSQKINYKISDDLCIENAKLLLSNYPESNKILQQSIELSPYEALIYYKNNN